MADIRKLTDELSVAAQLTPADIAEAEHMMFQSIICNRPDLEESGQPPFREIQEKIVQSGLSSEFQPVDGGSISDKDIEIFSAHVENLPKPVLAYCRTGTRCTVLWALSEAGKRPTDEILETAARAGYALEPLRARIEHRAEQIHKD